jgi:hypothetical protein
MRRAPLVLLERHSTGARKGTVVEGGIRLLAMGGGLGQSEVWIRSGEAVSASVITVSDEWHGKLFW